MDGSTIFGGMFAIALGVFCLLIQRRAGDVIRVALRSDDKWARRMRLGRTNVHLCFQA
jgi:hypothetical protein